MTLGLAAAVSGHSVGAGPAEAIPSAPGGWWVVGSSLQISVGPHPRELTLRLIEGSHVRLHPLIAENSYHQVATAKAV